LAPFPEGLATKKAVRPAAETLQAEIFFEAGNAHVIFEDRISTTPADWILNRPGDRDRVVSCSIPVKERKDSQSQEQKGGFQNGSSNGRQFHERFRVSAGTGLAVQTPGSTILP